VKRKLEYDWKHEVRGEGITVRRGKEGTECEERPMERENV
jgi:hypothetical protein